MKLPIEPPKNDIERDILEMFKAEYEGFIDEPLKIKTPWLHSTIQSTLHSGASWEYSLMFSCARLSSILCELENRVRLMIASKTMPLTPIKGPHTDDSPH